VQKINVSVYEKVITFLLSYAVVCCTPRSASDPELTPMND